MIKKVKDPGFGYNSRKNAQNIINKDGTSNVIHINRKFKSQDFYAFFIEIKWWKFFCFTVLGYTLLNIIFGFIYTFIGVDQIAVSKGIFIDDFLNGFFFSAQTLTTVGYGGVAPKGIMSNTVSTFEAMIGLLYFSVITGLLYGRFSKARASILFSDNFILRDFQGERALMFRLMNRRKTIMIEPKIDVTLSITQENENKQYKQDFYKLSLERDKLMYLPTVWTVVHTIDMESPLYKYSDDEILNLDAKLYLLIQYHEESFGQKVYQISSYDFSELEVGMQYTPSFYFDNQGYTVLNHNKLSEIQKMS